MASLTMMASFLGGAASISDRASVGQRHSLIVAKAAKAQEIAEPNRRDSRGDSNGRRAVMLAAAAAAAVGVVGQGIATAEEEPKPGTAEAKKKYAPVCVTMPTAKICHK